MSACGSSLTSGPTPKYREATLAVNTAAPQLISISRPAGSMTGRRRSVSACRQVVVSVVLNHHGNVWYTDGAWATASATNFVISEMLGAGSPAHDTLPPTASRPGKPPRTQHS